MPDRIESPWGERTPYDTLAVIGKAGLGTPHMGRQHAAVHGDRRPGPQGDVRHGRAARDLQDRHLMAGECEIAWTVIGQAAQGARDRELLDVADAAHAGTVRRLKRIKTRMKQAAPQALIVAP